MGFQIISKVFVRNTFGRNGKANLFAIPTFQNYISGQGWAGAPGLLHEGILRDMFFFWTLFWIREKEGDTKKKGNTASLPCSHFCARNGTRTRTTAMVKGF